MIPTVLDGYCAPRLVFLVVPQRHGQGQLVTCSGANRDGSLREVMVDKVLLHGADGRASGILCVFMDISEFRNAERATREARDAAEESRRRATRPLERDLERVLLDLTGDFPLLATLVERRRDGQQEHAHGEHGDDRADAAERDHHPRDRVGAPHPCMGRAPPRATGEGGLGLHAI